VGMRERAGLYGGEFEAGPLAGGGWRVRARIPLADGADRGVSA
jgi:signal transduction histidine kinase